MTSAAYWTRRELLQRYLLQWADHNEWSAIQHTPVDLSGADVLVPEYLLDGPDIVAALE